MGMAVALGLACGGITDVQFQYTVDPVTPDVLPAIEPGRIYLHRRAGLNADSLIRKLLNDRIRVDEMWEPTENNCAAQGDPDEPRLTVILTAADTRMPQNEFDPGNGITQCTTRVNRWLIARNF